VSWHATLVDITLVCQQTQNVCKFSAEYVLGFEVQLGAGLVLEQAHGGRSCMAEKE
jgi:hypothetical protein